MTARKIGWLLVAFLMTVSIAGLTWVVARRMSRAAAVAPPVAPTQRAPVPYDVAETVFDGGLASGWRDWGWGPHEFRDAGPARIKFSDFGGIILQHEALATSFGALVFRFQAPPKWGDFLQVSLKYKQLDESVLPRVAVESRYLADVGDGWREALVPWQALNPSGKPFDRITIEAKKTVGGDWVLVDHVVLTKPDAAGRPTSPAREARLVVDCNKSPVPISPLIYGIASAAPGLGETAHRVGGNTSSRFNWEGNVWNTGSDWYFENVALSKGSVWEWVDEARTAKIRMAVTVPMIGWVAKDAVSVGFPIAKFGPQRAQDPGRQAGDGFRSDGTPLKPDPPTATSVELPPETVRRWIETIRKKDATLGARGVWMYILDNEPDLWHGTHRDAHPDPVGYDELLDRSVRYGTAIRQADPEALIAGPASWGWTGYFYSAKDSVTGVREHADRRAHGDVPLLAWYLRSLAEHEKKTGVRILDVLDVHFYPQSDGIYGKSARTDPEAAALRLRSTRALWDVSYRDESWIDKAIFLLPRLKELVAQNYPDRGISLGEWSFGAEEHMSGGLAVAEALGRFAQFGITSAFYSFEIKKDTPAFEAFRAFRNFDGKGGRFLDSSIPTEGPGGISLFASRDASGSRIVAIALNLDPNAGVQADIDLASCGAVRSRRVYSYTAGSPGLVEETAPPSPDPSREKSARVTLPPYSINVIDIAMRESMKP